MSNGVRLRASIQIAADSGWRRAGWRAACEIDGLSASDGSTLFGFEATPTDGERFEPGVESAAELWLWAPELPQLGLAPNQSLRIFEGKTQVASGKIVEVLRGD